MALGITPDLLSFSTMSRNVADLKSRADIARTEATTQRIEDITAHTRGNVGEAHLLKKAVDDVIAYQDNIAFAVGRAATTQTVLGSINTDSARVAAEALAAAKRDDDAVLRTSAEQARGAITTVFAALNASIGGRALFGGDVAEQFPLSSPDQLISDIEAIVAAAPDLATAEAQIDTYFNDPAGGFMTNIYQGGSGDAPDVEIAPGVRVDVSVRADAQEIRDMLRGLAAIAVFESAGFAEGRELAESGANRTLETESTFADLRAVIGDGEARLENARARYADEQAALTTLFNQRTARDPFEAATELELLETQLESSYLLTARLSQLSLANFLR